jgi:hypothetical protein
MASAFLEKVKTVAVTIVGGVGGALGGGPVGLGIGLVGGALVDVLRSKLAPSAAAMPAAVIPGPLAPGVPTPTAATGGGLPPSADLAAASSAVHLMLLGQPNEVAPAQFWLKKFQASVGRPQSGQLDPTTRQMLTIATAGGAFDASRLPATTILG